MYWIAIDEGKVGRDLESPPAVLVEVQAPNMLRNSFLIGNCQHQNAFREGSRRSHRHRPKPKSYGQKNFNQPLRFVAIWSFQGNQK